MARKTKADSAAAFKSALMDAMLAITVQKELSAERQTVKDCFAAVLFEVMAEYMEKDTRLARELVHLTDALHNKEDEIVGALDIMTRQALWATLGMLRKERVRRHGRQEGQEGAGQASADGASGT